MMITTQEEDTIDYLDAGSPSRVTLLLNLPVSRHGIHSI